MDQEERRAPLRHLGDKPFQSACEPLKTLHVYATLSTLLDRIIFADAVAGFIATRSWSASKIIKEDAKQEFEDGYTSSTTKMAMLK